MRIEGSSYLPVPGVRRPVDVTPVQQVVLPEQEARQAYRSRPTVRSEDDGFEDALMQVSVPDQPQSRIAMLYEVQRLAQGWTPHLPGGKPFQAALAYDVSMARGHLERLPAALPATRV